MGPPTGIDTTPARSREGTPKQQHTLDIVFLQDATGSQGPYIQACKSAITNICNKVSEHIGSTPTSESQSFSSSSKLEPIRFGLVAFRDHPPEDTSYVTKNFGFTSSVGEMKKWLGGLVASGGGDGPEASTAAMAEALNMEWRQSEEDEAGEGKKGVKVVKIVVLITDAPPHGLGELEDGFPKGSPDQNDPLDIARQMAEHGISLYVIACEPTLSRYKNAVDFYRALTQITSGQMVPLLNASQLGDYIIGSALETIETEEILSRFQKTILEDVYGKGKSINEVIQGVQKELSQQQVQMQTVQVESPYSPSMAAEANVATWINGEKIGDVRGKVQEVGPRMSPAYYPGYKASGHTGGPGPAGPGISDYMESEEPATVVATRFTARAFAGGSLPPTPTPEYGIPSSVLKFGGGEKIVFPEAPMSRLPAGRDRSPQSPMSRLPVSEEQSRRIVMQGLSRHSIVSPGGVLSPRRAWPQAAGRGEARTPEGHWMDVDGPSAN